MTYKSAPNLLATHFDVYKTVPMSYLRKEILFLVILVCSIQAQEDGETSKTEEAETLKPEIIEVSTVVELEASKSQTEVPTTLESQTTTPDTTVTATFLQSKPQTKEPTSQKPKQEVPSTAEPQTASSSTSVPVYEFLVPTSFCNQYYRAKKVGGRWEVVLNYCPNGESFDIPKKSCKPNAAVDCQARLFVDYPQGQPKSQVPMVLDQPKPQVPVVPDQSQAQVPAVPDQSQPQVPEDPDQSANAFNQVPVVPEYPGEVHCDGHRKYEAPICYQYIECVKHLWWYTPEVKNCPTGKGFDSTTGTCACAALVNCTLPHPADACKGPGTLVGPNCGEYYECKRTWIWGYEPVLKRCERGLQYDKMSCKCVRSEEECSDEYTGTTIES